jgi:hypothetical protein
VSTSTIAATIASSLRITALDRIDYTVGPPALDDRPVTACADGFYARVMGTRWVLRTETKGTGARVVPLEDVRTPATTVEPVRVPRKPVPRPPAPAAPPAPHRFRIVDLLSRAPIVDDVGVAGAVAALRGVRSVVDIAVYVWQPARERWRLLTLSEQQALFDLAAD